MAIMDLLLGRQRCLPMPTNWKALLASVICLAVIASCHPVPNLATPEDRDQLSGEGLSIPEDQSLQVLPAVAPPFENSIKNEVDLESTETSHHELRRHRAHEPTTSSKKHTSDETRHHESAVRVSSVFPVDPDELESSLHQKNHHGSEAEGDNSSLTRRKRHSNLLADTENMEWVDDVEEKAFPEDVFNYYVQGGEGAKYGIETAPAPIEKDTAVHDWFYSELETNGKESQDDFIPDDVAGPEMDFIADMEKKVPVHVVTRIAQQPMQDAVTGKEARNVRKPTEQELEESFAPVIADLIAREQSQNWEELYKKFPSAEVGKHPPTFNRPTAIALSIMAGFVSIMAGLTIYMCRPKHEGRQERANAMKPLYDEPRPAEVGDMTLEDMEALLE